MKLYERDLPGEFNLKTNFSKDAYKAFLDKLKTDYPELVSIFKNDEEKTILKSDEYLSDIIDFDKVYKLYEDNFMVVTYDENNLINSLKASIERREKLLSNENYVNKAPANIVEMDRQKLEEEKNKLKELLG